MIMIILMMIILIIPVVMINNPFQSAEFFAGSTTE